MLRMRGVSLTGSKRPSTIDGPAPLSVHLLRHTSCGTSLLHRSLLLLRHVVIDHSDLFSLRALVMENQY